MAEMHCGNARLSKSRKRLLDIFVAAFGCIAMSLFSIALQPRGLFDELAVPGYAPNPCMKGAKPDELDDCARSPARGTSLPERPLGDQEDALIDVPQKCTCGELYDCEHVAALAID